MIRVKPSRPGLVVRDPVTKKKIDDEGVTLKKLSVFYIRRLQAGDLVLLSEEQGIPDSAAEAQPKAAAKKVKKGEGHNDLV